VSGLLDLVREDLRSFAGYSSARRAGVTGSVWLNANESAWRNPADAGLGANRYPDPQPAVLRERLAAIYGVRTNQVLVGRGSDEAIDLLVRALCRPGQDAVVIAPPVFGMYAVSARLQGAPLVEVPLRDGATGFELDLQAVADAAVSSGAKLVFLCSPANPTGQAIPSADLLALARRLAGRCLLVVDEAYGEYSDQPSLATKIDQQPNLAVLRTLSKAHALAAARIGCLLAAPELVEVLRNCQAPYPLPSPCVQLALAGLSEAALAQTRGRVLTVRAERERLRHELAACAGVVRVYPSQGNYLLVRFADAETAFARLLAAGVVVRDMRASPQLGDALRISIGSPAENDALLAALQAGRVAA
jgi:histidinol-phosphate aminotransferase